MNKIVINFYVLTVMLLWNFFCMEYRAIIQARASLAEPGSHPLWPLSISSLMNRRGSKGQLGRHQKLDIIAASGWRFCGTEPWFRLSDSDTYDGQVGHIGHPIPTPTTDDRASRRDWTVGCGVGYVYQSRKHVLYI